MITDTGFHLRHADTPLHHTASVNHPTQHPASEPTGNPPSQVLSLGNQTLMNRAGEQGDAVHADHTTKVLAGNTSPGVAGKTQNIFLFLFLIHRFFIISHVFTRHPVATHFEVTSTLQFFITLIRSRFAWIHVMHLMVLCGSRRDTRKCKQKK